MNINLQQMKNTLKLLIILTIFCQSCATVKVESAWKANQDVIDGFKTKNILVIARTADNQARVAFEKSITDVL